GILVFLNK
ncbi:hypothetical protein NPIL_554461, partial [Nephila pilipes]